MESKKWEKPPTRSARPWQRDPLVNQRDTAATGHEILWDSEGNPPHSPSETNPHTKLTTPLWQTQSRTLHHHFRALSPGFLIYLVGLPEASLWDVPVREHPEPGSAGCQQLAQHSLPWIGFGRVAGICPESWLSCHSEHLHLHHFWVLMKGQGATNRAAKGTRDFLYRNPYLNHIQKGNTKAIQRKATLEFLCKKLRTQGLLKHLITNIHLLFISPI